MNEHLGDDFWLGRFPVTVAQYRVFVEDSGHKPEDPDCLRVLPNRPVRYITWHEALKFCKWLTARWQKSGLLAKGWQVTLPSEAEWEKAARGGLEIPEKEQVLPIAALVETSRRGVSTVEDMVMIENTAAQRRYPWGDNEDPNRANYHDTQIGTTSAVGCFGDGPSPYGCEELSGNVWEWTRSVYKGYEYDPHDGREDLTASVQVRRVLRVGSWYYYAQYCRCEYRYFNDPDFRAGDVGFRLVLLP